MATLGSVPFRTAVGDRPRGLQRRRRRLVVLQPRSGPLASLSLGRGRTRRLLRRPAAPVLCGGPLERSRPDHQGAPVRPDEPRGEPRRGRQGVLLLPRRHPDQLVPALPLQVPAGRIPLRRPRRRPIAVAVGPRIPSTSCSTLACSTDDRYFDVVVEYAKATPEDIAIRITVSNRGPDSATLHLLPTLWFRNHLVVAAAMPPRPRLTGRHPTVGAAISRLRTPSSASGLPVRHRRHELLFTENETNLERLAGAANRTPYVKDAFDAYLVHGRRDAVHPERIGTKAAAHYDLTIEPGGSQVVDCGWSRQPARRRVGTGPVGGGHRRARSTFGEAEADDFYASVIPASLDEDRSRVMRQALAGMLWSKQTYHYDVNRWLGEHGDRSVPLESGAGGQQPALAAHARRRSSSRCRTSGNTRGSRPGTWPSTCVALTLVDEDFAKEQLELMLRAAYLHPNGQLPAYEWNFGDVNPPVHAWATIFTYRLEEARAGEGDLDWLERIFHKLLLNFTWWVNRKDAEGNNLFEGGFLGLDNIGVFDRAPRCRPAATSSRPTAPPGWRCSARTCSRSRPSSRSTDPAYIALVAKFVEHFLWIATVDDARRRRHRDVGRGGRLLLRRPPPARRQRPAAQGALDGRPAAVLRRHRVRRRAPRAAIRSSATRCGPSSRRGPSCARSSTTRPSSGSTADGSRRSSTRRKLRRVLARMLDETEFLSPHGIRSLSRYHLEHPYVFEVGGAGVPGRPTCRRSRTAGCSAATRTGAARSGCPSTRSIIRALLQYHAFYGDDFTVECPTGSGTPDDPVPGGRGDRAAGSPRSSCATSTAGGRSTARRRASRTTRTGAT